MTRPSERLTIKAFAGLKNVVIEPARVTAIIGPQASGKSVSAKLLFFFRSIWTELLYVYEGDLSPDDRKDRIKAEFRRFFPVETWGDEIFVLQYEVGDNKVQLRRAPSRGRPSEGLILSLPPFVDELLALSRALLIEAVSTVNQTALSFSATYGVWRKIEPLVKGRLDPIYFGRQMFIPAGRAFFSNIENNIFSFLSHSEKNLDPFLARFGSYFAYLKSGGVRRSRHEYSTPLAKGLLGGKLVVEKDKEFVQTSDNRILPLSNLSSGQQEALPLLMMLEPPDENMGLGRSDHGNRVATYIEEPEAHLFPDFQRIITERIAEYAMAKDGAQSVVITTHSPYVLSTLNNLLLAGRIGSRRRMASAVSGLIPQSRWLPKGSVQAYAFVDGECRSMLDDNVGLIDADYLDSVSSSIAGTFEKLLDLESPNQSHVASGEAFDVHE